MIEPINELKQITQGEKRATQSAHYGWLRDISIYVTWVLLHTSISANQVTLMSIFLGIAGAVCISMPDPRWGLVGCLLVGCYLVLDKVDGEIARYRKTQSLRGILLDEIGHLVLQPLLFGGLAWHVFTTTMLPIALVFGMLTALQVGWSRVLLNLHYRVYAKKAIHQAITVANTGDIQRQAYAQRIERMTKPIMKPLRVFQHHYWVPLLIFVAYLLEVIYPSSIGLVWSYMLLVGAAIAQTVLFVHTALLSFLSFEVAVAEVDRQVRHVVVSNSEGIIHE